MKLTMTERALAARRANVAAIAARRRAQTHCKHGHEFTPENTYITKDGRRSCRKCQCDIVYYRSRGLSRPEAA